MNVRAALACATLAAALCAIVAARRVEESGPAFCVLLGGAALIFGPVLAGLSVARPLSFGLRAVLLGLGLAALPLSRLAAILKAVTHHRPLGAVTFAALALMLCAGSILVAARLLVSVAQSSRARALTIGLVALALAGPALLLVRAAESPSLRDGLVDVSLGLGVGSLLLQLRFPPAARRAFSLGALPLWLGTLLVGIASAFALGVGPAERSSPALAAPISWLFR